MAFYSRLMIIFSQGERKVFLLLQSGRDSYSHLSAEEFLRRRGMGDRKVMVQGYGLLLWSSAEFLVRPFFTCFLFPLLDSVR